MELYQLRYFAYAAKYENITMAAQELNVSQPSISKAIQSLERELKTELLAKGYTGNSRVGTSGLEKQYEDILKASNSSYSVKYIRTVNQQPFYGIMWPYLYLNPFVANKIDSAFILMQRVYCRIKKIGG